jgi:hypothetical protein
MIWYWPYVRSVGINFDKFMNFISYDVKYYIEDLFE